MQSQKPLLRAARTGLAVTLMLVGAQLSCTGAFAHHPTGGQLPATMLDGVLSGLGHPVIGVDHLVFIVGIGLLAAVTGFGPLLPVLFVAAMGGGLAMHMAGVNLPGAELAVATSAALIGLAVARPRTAHRNWLEGSMFALAGAFHGYALAESIIGAETTPLAAYIAGLVICQATIALAAYLAARGRVAMPDAPLVAVPVRVAGLTIFAVGALFAARLTGFAA